jgi:hypothetical protein
MLGKRKNWDRDSDISIIDGKTGQLKVKDGKLTKYSKEILKKNKSQSK